MKFDINQHSSGRKRTFGILLGAVIVVILLAWQIWFQPSNRNNFNLSHRSAEAKTDLPFQLTTDNLCMEIRAGSFVKIMPMFSFHKTITVKTVLSKLNMVDTLSSFQIEPHDKPSIFVPVHSKDNVGLLDMTFQTEKQSTLENLSLLKIKIKIVYSIVIEYLSLTLGWAYFLIWSISYYPQLIKNFHRHSVVGISFDYVALNFTGHLCYCIFNTALYFNSGVQGLYKESHPSGELPVKANDVFFSLHSMVMMGTVVLQCLTYERGDQRVSFGSLVFVLGIWISILIGVFAAITEHVSWLRLLYYLVFVKLSITPLKYSPQVYLHYERKSTDGWSIIAVTLDGLGGLLSLTQMLLDAANLNDWDSISGNPGKIGLGAISLGYNCIFAFQHFCLYYSSNSKSHQWVKNNSDLNQENLWKKVLKQKYSKTDVLSI